MRIDAPPLPSERAGHIPGACHLPHITLLQGDGCYRPIDELRAIARQLELQYDREIITYCTAGIRSALLWFALRHLLGMRAVFNYDGSWNEWSRMGEETDANDRR